MLRQKIKRIEKSLGGLRVSKQNINSIYQFFITGDEDALPYNPTNRDTYLAAKKSRMIGLSKCPGLHRTFEALKTEKLVNDEEDLFRWLKNLERTFPICRWEHQGEERKLPDGILMDLGLIKVFIICFSKNKRTQN